MDAIYHKALNDTTAGATANPLVSDCNCGMSGKPSATALWYCLYCDMFMGRTAFSEVD